MRSEIFQPLSNIRRIGLLLIFSLGYYLLSTFIYLGLDGTKWAQTYHTILYEVPLVTGYIYLLHQGIAWLLIILEKKRSSYRLAVVRMVVQLLLVSVGSTLLITLVLVIPEKLLSAYLPVVEVPDSGLETVMRMRLLYVLNALFACFFYTTKAERQIHRRLYLNELAKEKLEKESYQAQFELLNRQVSPHFLFNNLNTLAALIKKDPSSATQFLGQLSGLFRCVLEYQGKELVTLQAEMKLVDTYVYLLKTRFRDNLRITIDLGEANECYSIPPLTLQPLIEGAIRYNIISSEYPLSISIRVNGKHQLVFTSGVQKRNDAAEYTGKEPELEAIKRRFHFFTTESIEISYTHDEFIISLPLIETAPSSMAS